MPKQILIALAIALASIALFGCSVNAGDLSIPNKITSGSIKVYNDKMTIEKNGINWGKLPDTGSMLPALPHNSTIIWVTDFNELSVGDIVMTNLTEGNCRVTHRIIVINGEDYVLKGDNNPIPDNCNIKRENIYALIVGVIY